MDVRQPDPPKFVDMKPLLRQLILSSLVFYSALSAHAAVDVVVESKVFHVPGGEPRVEVNMAFLAGSMVIGMDERGFHRARVEATTIIERDGAVVTFSKAEVLGEERLDSLPTDLVHQEYFRLPPGDYELSVEVKDLNSATEATTRYHAPLAVGARGEGIVISELMLAQSIDPSEEPHAKFGYQVVPLISDYFPRELKQLNFYAEVYGTDEAFGNDSLYLLTYQLENFEKGGVFGSYKKNIRAKARPVEPVFAQFDISELPSGNYLLSVEVRDKKGELKARREQFMQRNNPMPRNYDPLALNKVDISNTFVDRYTDRDTLAEYVNSLSPIADPLERKIIQDRWQDRDMEHMKRFLYTFWSNRNPADPEGAWQTYQEQVVKVNKLFSCRILKGYETDRGRVYLQYGAPNTMMDRLNEPGTLPYSIWHYYRAGRYSNKRFVFYQPDLANYCMQLLHSEVPGEIQNPQWNNILHMRNVAMPGVQGRDPGTLESDRVREFYNDPR